MRSRRLLKVLWWMAVNLCRMILSLALIFSGVVKMIDPHGTEYKIWDYIVAFDMHKLLPEYLAFLLSAALALAEFCLGVNLFFGSNRRWTSRTVLAFFLVFTPFTLYLALENPVHECGCFGDAWVLTNWQSFGKNMLLLVCAMVVCLCYRRQTRLISIHSQWLVSIYTWLFAFALTSYCAYTLPVIDFRPYHIGADLHRQMQWDESGNIPPISDLVITDPLSGEDLTDSIVSGRGWKFLIVMPRVETADDGVMDNLTELTDYCNEHGYPLFALTSSGDDKIEYWRDITGAEYPFLVADEIPLKTMLRSNPGLMLLDGSKVVNKWASTQLPGAPQLKAPLEDMPDFRKEEVTYSQRALRLLAWYLIPLAILTFLDGIWTTIKFLRERE